MNQDLKIALVQTSLVWEDPEQNRLNFESIIGEIPEDTNVIVLPEMFTTGFTMHPEHIQQEEGDKTVAWMKALARKTAMAILGSISYRDNDEYTNRLFFVYEEGTVYYDKRHTFTLAGEDMVYRAGKSKLIVDYKGFKLCPMICYDLRFPVWSRNAENYDVLIYVANWPAPRIAAWDTLLKARAIENMAYCIGVNRVGTDNNGHKYSGHSSAYDCLGEQLCFSDEATVLYATLERQHITATRKKLNFLKDMDTFNLVIP
ncbi:MAG: amidohydrolase [Eudoraea sp.]|nr:amidohydrolase [Eudoraea sp.]